MPEQLLTSDTRVSTAFCHSAAMLCRCFLEMPAMAFGAQQPRNNCASCAVAIAGWNRRQNSRERQNVDTFCRKAATSRWCLNDKMSRRRDILSSAGGAALKGEARSGRQAGLWIGARHQMPLKKLLSGRGPGPTWSRTQNATITSSSPGEHSLARQLRQQNSLDRSCVYARARTCDTSQPILLSELSGQTVLTPITQPQDAIDHKSRLA